MFCSNCGAQIPDDSKFCPKCGHPASNVITNQGSQNVTPKIPHVPTGNYGSQTVKKSSGNFKKIIPIIAVCAAAVLVIILIAANHKTTVNLSKYITITTEGYDTLGTASYDFDSAQFSKDYDGKLKPDKKGVQKAIKEGGSDVEYLLDLFGGSDNIAEIISNTGLSDYVGYVVSGNLSPDKNLSNGDTVTFTWNLSESDLNDLEEIFNCKFEADDVTLKVSDLKEVEQFDPFEGMTVTYDGIAPSGTISEISRGSDCDPACLHLNYSADKYSGLSNGDKITVSISDFDSYEQENFVENYGKIPSPTSKEFVVSGLSSYVTTAADIPEDTMNQMKSQAKDAFDAETASDWDQYVELVDFDYIGNYFLSSISPITVNHNMIYLIYKVRAHVYFKNSSDGSVFDQNVDYYWYCQFEDLLLTADGECQINLTNYETPWIDETGFYANNDFAWYDYFHGYENLDLMYDDLSSQNTLDHYNVEDNVKDITLNEASGAQEADKKDSATDSAAEESSDSEDNSGEILPFSSDRKLTEDDLDGLNKDDLQTAINEIYARHGYTFKDPDILAYFEQFDWYKPTVAASDFSNNVLTTIENENIKFIQEHMN